jgi:hypothetical protein
MQKPFDSLMLSPMNLRVAIERLRYPTRVFGFHRGRGTVAFWAPLPFGGLQVRWKPKTRVG